MKVLLINGSPKGTRSNTYRLSRAFLEGMGAEAYRERTVSQMDIRPCLGCFGCWNKTPGKCVHTDDMESILQDLLWADVTIWSFPLYFFSVPGPMKNLMDRQLPLSLPFMSGDAESGGHPSRYDMTGKRNVVISTCGFYTAEGNYQGVEAIFDHLCGKGNYTAIFCGQGELFRVKELNSRTAEYLSWVRQAGQEFASGGISRETEEKLKTLLYPREVFEAMADASWGVEESGEKTEEYLTFTRQMAALYNPSSWDGKNRVLEMYYTDLDKACQILMEEKGSRVLSSDFLSYTTRIETPYTLWKAIASGEETGQDALMQGKYRVKGDFDLMIHWDRYFGQQREEPTKQNHEEKTANMAILLLPWILLWAVTPANPVWGAYLSLLLCAGSTLLFRKYRRTVYDDLSGLLVAMTAVGILCLFPLRLMLPLSYLAFGLMWSLSCFRPVPLTAHYSAGDYGGEGMLQNPLFIRTNRILTACWGVLYLLTPIWTYLLMGTSVSSWTGAINSILPMLMGLFTAWFQKWYPAKIARGE